MPAEAFAARLIAWQRGHGRHDLPWQQSRDAYRVWLSEIMLQQTQVATVIPYYRRFLDAFPTVEALAAAPLDAVLERWSGLGYYARARNLHRCAQVLVADHGGRFPKEAHRIAELPGIGRSTAAAIAAFAFGARGAILDGNVKRVLARCFGVEGFPGQATVERKLWALAESLLPAVGIEAYTQGLMDLGATRCVRGKPRCEVCPLKEMCVARRDGTQQLLPTPKPRKALPEREASVLFFTDGRRVLLERRPPSGLWGGLLAPVEAPPEAAAGLALRLGCRLLATQPMAPLKHTFTHFRLSLQPLCCAVEASACLAAEPGWSWLALDDIDRAALPTPIRKLLHELG